MKKKLRKLLIEIINIYQNTPFRSHSSCIYIPTCSEYTKEAIKKYGAFKGTIKGTRRILRCHPWHKNAYDPLL